MKIIAVNKEAEKLYNIEEKFEAGIALTGTEVKSLREGNVSLKDGYAKIKNNELYLCNVHISEYKNGSLTNHNPKRERKLLLHKSEIKRLIGKQQQRGWTIVPLKIYFKDKWAKVELGLGKGKTKVDIREKLKKDEHRIAIERAYKKSKLKNL
jgi:SsrA-binding protein